MDRKSVYESKGIPYRRGVLLHGPPGTGKSSFIRGLAAHFQYGLCLLPTSFVKSDAHLMQIVRAVPMRTFVVMEDIDRLFRHDAVADTWKPITSITMSGLLNALDGAFAAHGGTIFFFTTNHLQDMNPALIRMGRMDIKVQLGFAVREQVQRMFDKFFPDASAEHRDAFADVIASCGDVTTAQVQEVCLSKLGDDMGDVLQAARGVNAEWRDFRSASTLPSHSSPSYAEANSRNMELMRFFQES